jgi:hypothetical protein
MFDSTYRYFKFHASLLEDLATLLADYGEKANTAPDAGGIDIITLGCGLDDRETGKLRALNLGVDCEPITLADGEKCLGAYWTVKSVNAFNEGEIEGDELTAEQVKLLMPVSEI